MIASIYKMEFTTSNGSAYTMLSWGDWIDKLIEFPMQNQVQTFSAIGAQWGKARAMGGARRPVDWTRMVTHASHAAAAAYCLSHPGDLPFTTPGKLRVYVYAGATTAPIIYDLMDAVIVAIVPRMTNEDEFATLTSYRVEAGKTTHISG